MTRSLWTIAFAAALVAGAALRLVWIEDMEYKADEQYMFAAAQQYRATHHLPRAGNAASVGLPNPGVSAWPFVIPARVFGWSSPLALARLVQVLAIAALVLLTWFAFRSVDRAEREPWLWAIALASVNPLAVTIERKIWTPSILPLFLVVALMGWWRKHTTRGAFTWGLIGCLVAEIQLGCAFVLAGFGGWALIFDRAQVRWRAWLAGVAAAAALSIPWAMDVLVRSSPAVVVESRYDALRHLRFWRYFVLRAIGFGLDYSLGPSHRDFLAQPIVFSTRTCLVLVAYLICAAVGSVIAARAAIHVWRTRPSIARCLGLGGGPTAFTVSAALFGVGLAFSLTGIPIHRHYLEVVYPFSFLAVAWVALMPPFGSSGHLSRVLLASLCIAQLTLSAAFLGFIHSRGGAPGDYGVSYRLQQPAR